jgi:hypothetical protein
MTMSPRLVDLKHSRVSCRGATPGDRLSVIGENRRFTFGCASCELGYAELRRPHPAGLPKALSRRLIWRFVRCLAQQTLEVT